MTYTTIIISANITTIQRHFLTSAGFSIIGKNFSKTVKSNELHIVIAQLAKNSIPFNLKTNPPNYPSAPCPGCKK